MLYVKQRPETCGNRPCGRRHQRDAVLEHRLELGAVHLERDDDVPEREHREHLPAGDLVRRRRERRAEAGAAGNAGHVRASRSPPEFVIANSTPIELYFARIASVVTSPTSDSHSLPSTRPTDVGAGISTDRRPDHLSEDRLQLRVERVDPAWIAGSGVTPMVHGLWKSAVL